MPGLPLDGIVQEPIAVHALQVSHHFSCHQTGVEHFSPQSAENCWMKLILSAQAEASPDPFVFRQVLVCLLESVQICEPAGKTV